MAAAAELTSNRPAAMRPSDVTLLVNSCDAFEDCWEPFFTLLGRYWPTDRPPVLLNTELRVFDWEPYPVRSSAVARGQASRPTWSECLLRALDQVETPLVLYLQEDYFIEKPVDLQMVRRCSNLMIANPEIAHIGLTHFGSSPPFLPSPHAGLETIAPKARYRVSTQAGLWRLETLKSVIRPWESGWMFELFGTVRSWRSNECFLTVQRGAGPPPIAYQHTGIVKGQWSKFVPELFARENLCVDFEKRGFYDDLRPAWQRRLQLLGMVARRPSMALRSLLS